MKHITSENTIIKRFLANNDSYIMSNDFSLDGRSRKSRSRNLVYVCTDPAMLTGFPVNPAESRVESDDPPSRLFLEALLVISTNRFPKSLKQEL